MLSLDLRNNPGFSERSANCQLMKLIFLRNLREAIAKYHQDHTRVKLEWVYPHALGQTGNKLDQKDNTQEPKGNRTLFIKLIKEISKETEIEMVKVLQAFIGSTYKEQKDLQKKIMKLVRQTDASSELSMTRGSRRLSSTFKALDLQKRSSASSKQLKKQVSLAIQGPSLSGPIETETKDPNEGEAGVLKHTSAPGTRKSSKNRASSRSKKSRSALMSPASLQNSHRKVNTKDFESEIKMKSDINFQMTEKKRTSLPERSKSFRKDSRRLLNKNQFKYSLAKDIFNYSSGPPLDEDMDKMTGGLKRLKQRSGLPSKRRSGTKDQFIGSGLHGQPSAEELQHSASESASSSKQRLQ